MMEAAADAYRRALVRWTEAVRRFAAVVVLASLVVTILAGVHVAGNFRINTDTDDMLSPDLPFRRLSAELDKAFPQFNNNILIVIDGETPDLADDAARALAAKLRKRPALFGRVYDPAGSAFLRRNGFLYLSLEDLYELSDKLAAAQPFLGTLWRDPSLVGLFGMLDLAIEEYLKDPGKETVELATVLDAMTEVARAQAAGRFGQLSWQELMAGTPADEDEAAANRRLILIQPNLDFGSLRPAAEAIEALRALFRRMHLDPAHGVTVRLTGSAALAHEELESVEQGMGLAGALSITLVIGLLFVGLRAPWLVAATAATLVIGLVWTTAFALAAIGTLNLISVAFAVLFIGLSVDFGIHYGLRYREGIDRGDGHGQALADAVAGVGGALTLCAVSAAIAFYSFLPTDYLGLAELGLIAGTGMFIAFFANLTVLPALLTVLPVTRPAAHRAAPRVNPARPGLQAAIRRHPRAVCWSALGLGVVAALMVPRATFDFDPLNLKDPNTESMAAIHDLMADTRTSPYTITVLADDLEAAQAMAEKLEALPAVDGAATLAEFVPVNQDEKLDVIATMGLFLSPAFASVGAAAPPTTEERRAALRAFEENLGKLARVPGGRPEADAARRLARALEELFGTGPPVPDRLKAFETRLLASLPGRLEALNAALGAEQVTLDSLPAEIRDAEIAPDGRARVKVYPARDLRDRDALEAFVEAVRSVTPDAAGSPVTILEAGEAVVAAFWQAGLISVVLISGLLVAVLRRLVDAALVFAPLALAALLTVATSVILDLPFNFANIIVLPLLFGLGVASGIHLVLREREEEGAGGAFETSTPRAVVFSALTTIGSFGSIALSSHPGTSSMGALLTIAITLTLACTLVVLPALMAVARPGRAA